MKSSSKAPFTMKLFNDNNSNNSSNSSGGSNRFYSGWIVESWTTQMRQDVSMTLTPEKLDQLKDPIPIEDVITLIASIVSISSELMPVMEKMKSRSSLVNGNLCLYTDPALYHINIWNLLQNLYNEVENNYPELKDLFIETLKDAGNTCVSGDSHRLFWLYSTILNFEKTK